METKMKNVRTHNKDMVTRARKKSGSSMFPADGKSNVYGYLMDSREYDGFANNALQKAKQLADGNSGPVYFKGDKVELAEEEELKK